MIRRSPQGGGLGGAHYALNADGFRLGQFNAARPFASFLPGIAGTHGKPMWVFYCNRGQCISSFGVQNKNNAMLEFHAANKAYALTALYGFAPSSAALKGTSRACMSRFNGLTITACRSGLTSGPKKS